MKLEEPINKERGNKMEDLVYFWDENVYCYRNKLEEFINKFGTNYNVLPATEFFS